MHSKHYLHRDIKPDNFVMGVKENQSTVYIIDYGLAKRYIDSKTRQHIPLRDDKKLAGTARFASVNTHLGVEQSRRDDIECLGYTLIYIAKGELPWQGVKGQTRDQKYNKIMQKKLAISTQSLCKGLPTEFVSYIKYCRSLNFEDKPDYWNLIKNFETYFLNNHYDIGFEFDWNKPKTIPANTKYLENEIVQLKKSKGCYHSLKDVKNFECKLPLQKGKEEKKEIKRENFILDKREKSKQELQNINAWNLLKVESRREENMLSIENNKTNENNISAVSNADGESQGNDKEEKGVKSPKKLFSCINLDQIAYDFEENKNASFHKINIEHNPHTMINKLQNDKCETLINPKHITEEIIPDEKPEEIKMNLPRVSVVPSLAKRKRMIRSKSNIRDISNSETYDSLLQVMKTFNVKKYSGNTLSIEGKL